MQYQLKHNITTSQYIISHRDPRSGATIYDATVSTYLPNALKQARAILHLLNTMQNPTAMQLIHRINCSSASPLDKLRDMKVVFEYYGSVN